MQRKYQLGFSIGEDGVHFQAWVHVENDGEIVITEQYGFLGSRVGGRQQEDYHDHVFVEAGAAQAFVVMLARHCREQVVTQEEVQTSSVEGRTELLFKVLEQLKREGQLGEASAIGESHRVLRGWLDEAGIRYEVVRSVWRSDGDDADGSEADKQEVAKQVGDKSGVRVETPIRRDKAQSYTLLHAYRAGVGLYFTLSLKIAEDGRLSFHEEYDYEARGEDEGREYHYALTIPATHFRDAVEVFVRESGGMIPVDMSRGDALLIDCLKRLVERGLGSSERINAALTTLQRWLNRAGIPYRLTRFVW